MKRYSFQWPQHGQVWVEVDDETKKVCRSSVPSWVGLIFPKQWNNSYENSELPKNCKEVPLLVPKELTT